MLKITNLCVEVGGKEILSDISLRIRRGETHVIVGPNASGKTTLAKTIMGLREYKIKGGGIYFNGREITGLKPEQRAKIGIALTFQHPPAIKGVKLSDFLRRIGNGCEHKKYVSSQLLEREINVNFSGGEQKFSELVQVLALNPKLIIFDEIDSGVDVKRLEQITGIIKDWLSRDRAALMVTHNATALEFLTPDIIHVLLNGKLIGSSNDWKKVWKTIKRHGYEKCKECEKRKLSAG